MNIILLSTLIITCSLSISTGKKTLSNENIAESIEIESIEVNSNEDENSENDSIEETATELSTDTTKLDQSIKNCICHDANEDFFSEIAFKSNIKVFKYKKIKERFFPVAAFRG